MISPLRDVRLFVFSLVCLGSLSCFRSLDASRLRCDDSKYCPSNYVCDTSKHHCVPSETALGDASSSEEVGGGMARVRRSSSPEA